MSDVSFLNPEFKDKLNELDKLCKKNNISFTITDAVRSESEQNYKFAKGRLAPGEVSTAGPYPNNYHCWGLAVDIESESNYEKIGKLAESIGLSWGGNNTEFKNPRHIEYRLHTLKYLRLTYPSYRDFRVTWDPEFIYNPAQLCVITEQVLLAANKQKMIIQEIQRACNMDGFRTKGRRILTISGKLDKETLEALSIVKMENDKRYSLIKRVQLILKKLGYKIEVTGKYDLPTKQIIIRFQRRYSMRPTGGITSELITAMLSKI